jgi:hypothetical protein
MPPDPERAFLDALQSVGVAPPQATTDAAWEEKLAEQPAVTAANIWRHPDAHPIALDMLVLQRYGPEWLTWEPETLHVLVPVDFKTPSLSDLNHAKLQACKTLHLVDSFWHRWEVFVACAMPFNNELPDFKTMQVPTAAQCLVAIDIAHRIREENDWSEEVKGFIAAVYKHDDIYLPLPPADFVTLDVPESVDQKKLAERWPEVRASGRTPTAQTMLDEQLRRLLIINGFLEESRARLRQQLRLHHA